ncbi:hypothetical protein GOB27_27625 [Sinorhizobium meliloti]|nr:hypothetical protein [Sinorhizobium meliloti]
MVKHARRGKPPTKDAEAALVEQVVADWCDLRQVDPMSHAAVSEGLRVLYMIREFQVTDRQELLRMLLAGDEGSRLPTA